VDGMIFKGSTMPKRTEDNIVVGARFKNNEGDWFTITSIKTLSLITIVFDGYDNHPTVRSKWLIETGQIKNYYKPSIHNIGFMGEGVYKSSRGHPAYKVWTNMLNRCYDTNLREYGRYGGRGVTVHEVWYNYQNFRLWYEDNYVQGYQLDKDLKVPKSKIYSPDTCLFVPKEINKLLISNNKFRSEFGVGVHPRDSGRFQAAYCCFSKIVPLGTFDTADEAFSVYKQAKEKHIKVVAELYKSSLPVEAYNTLMEWEVLRFPE
jgi:hypothetical protein